MNDQERNQQRRFLTIASRGMRRFFADCLLSVTAVTADCVSVAPIPSVWKSGTHHLTIDGRDRTFILDVPSKLKLRASLVMIFHGFTSSAKDVRELTGFPKVSERHRFVAVYPQGTRDSKGKTFFNVGYEFHRDQSVDDVRFARSLAERLTRDLGLDPRAVFSAQSGCAGAALWKRNFGENMEKMVTRFPYWLCRNAAKFARAEDDLPVDQHMLIACIAPRPVYVACGVEDFWADSRGEYLSVFRLLGKKGLDTEASPSVDQVLGTGDVGYHNRAGGHSVEMFDWYSFLDFAERHLKTR